MWMWLTSLPDLILVHGEGRLRGWSAVLEPTGVSPSLTSCGEPRNPRQAWVSPILWLYCELCVPNFPVAPRHCFLNQTTPTLNLCSSSLLSHLNCSLSHVLQQPQWLRSAARPEWTSEMASPLLSLPSSCWFPSSISKSCLASI